MRPTSHGDRKLKVATSALLRAMDAVTFIEIKVRTPTKRGQHHSTVVTDLDVLGVHTAPDLSVVRTVAECKSGSRDLVGDLYKLAGVVSSQRVDKALLVRTHIGAHVREVARSLSIWVADPEEIETLLKQWVPDVAKELAAEENYIGKSIEFGTDVGKRHPAETSFVLHDHWNVDDGRAIAGIVRAVGNIGNATVLELPDRAVLAAGLLAVGVRLLSFAGQVMRLYAHDPGLGARLQLAGGMRQLKERDALAAIIRDALPGEQASRVTGEPEYMRELAELAFRLFRAAPIASRCPSILERFTRWIVSDGTDVQLPMLTGLVQGATPESLKFAQDIAVALAKWTKLPGEPFRHLLAL